MIHSLQNVLDSEDQRIALVSEADEIEPDFKQLDAAVHHLEITGMKVEISEALSFGVPTVPHPKGVGRQPPEFADSILVDSRCVDQLLRDIDLLQAVN